MSTFLKHLVFSQLWVSFCALSFVAFFQRLSDTWHPPLLLFVFLSAWLTYRFCIGLYKTRAQQSLLLSLLLAILYCCSWLSSATFIYAILLGLVSLSYSTALIFRPIRRIPTVKIFVISFVWSNSCLLGMLESGLPMHEPLLFLGMEFTYILAITLPFDIRDLTADEPSLKTIPQMIGIPYTKTIALFSLLCSNSFLFLLHVDLSFLIVYPLASFYACCCIIFSSSKRKPIYYSLFVELSSAMPFFLLILYDFSNTMLNFVP